MRAITTFAMFALVFCLGACDRTPKNEQSFTNLFDAAKYGDVTAIKYLVSHGSIVDEIDSHGRTALAYAVMGHHLDAVKVLIASGAKKDVVTSKGYDLVMLSLYNEMDPSLDMLNYLVGLGLTVNRSTIDGDSALNIAISSRHEKAVGRLISLGAVPNERSKEILAAQTPPNATIVALINDAANKGKQSAKAGD